MSDFVEQVKSVACGYGFWKSGVDELNESEWHSFIDGTKGIFAGVIAGAKPLSEYDAKGKRKLAKDTFRTARELMQEWASPWDFWEERIRRLTLKYLADSGCCPDYSDTIISITNGSAQETLKRLEGKQYDEYLSFLVNSFGWVLFVYHALYACALQQLDSESESH